MAYFTEYSGSLDSDSVILVLHYEGTGGSRSISVTCTGGTVSSPNRTDVNATCSDGSGYDCLNFSITGLSSGTTYTATAYFDGSRACTYSFTTTGSSSGGGGDSGEDEEEDTKIVPTVPGIYDINLQGNYDGQYLTFNCDISFQNTDYRGGIYLRYQCTFGTGSSTYYGPHYPDGYINKPSRYFTARKSDAIGGFTRAGTQLVTYYDASLPKTAGTHTVTIPINLTVYYSNYLEDDSVGRAVPSDNTPDTITVTYTISKNKIYFNGKSALTESLRGTEVSKSILATQWNKFCENISGMSSYGNKVKGNSIMQAEVQRMLDQLGSSTTVGKDCLIDYFIEIETIYNSEI